MISEKEKAEELIEMFRMDNTAEGYRRGIIGAYRCVEEIIKSSPSEPTKDYLLPHYKAMKFWERVINEIKECES
jgi:hypothetical protein